jgi:hypothetical protein
MQGVNPAQQAAAAAIINQILMTPNPRGLAGVQGMQGGAMMGGGIAGVGLDSTVEGDSIMLYNDRSKYKEWEFVYDPTKEKPLSNPNGGGVIGTPASQMGSTPLGTSPFGAGTPGTSTPNSGGQTAIPGPKQ